MGESEEGLSDSLEFDCHHALFDDEDDRVIDNADDKDDVDEDKGYLMLLPAGRGCRALCCSTILLSGIQS